MLRFYPRKLVFTYFLKKMKRIGTVFILLFSLMAISAHAQNTRTRLILNGPNISNESHGLSASPIQPAPAKVDQPFTTVIKTDSIWIFDTTQGSTLLDPLNGLPNTPNPTSLGGDSLPLGKSVNQFGSITVNGTTFNDTLYRRVIAEYVATPTDITFPRLDSVKINVIPFAFDSRDEIQVWAVPIVDDSFITAQGSYVGSYPVPDLFSRTHNGTPYGSGAVLASSLKLGQLNTVTVNFQHKPMYINSKTIIPRFAIVAFDNGPGFFNDTLAFQMDLSGQQQTIDTDGTINGGPPMQSYWCSLDGGTNYVDPTTHQTEFITNNFTGFITGIYTQTGGNTLGNFVMVTYLSGNAPSGVNSVGMPENSLDGNYPNPVGTSTAINYNLAQSGPVMLTVYNTLGEKVQTVLNTVQGAGEHSANFNTGMLPNGMYYYKLQSGEFSATRTMVIDR